MSTYEYVLSIRGQIGCMCILLYIAWTFFSAKRTNNIAHKLFSAVIITSMVNLIFDMVTVYTVNHLDTTPPFLNRAFHVIFVSSFAVLLFYLYMYVRRLADKSMYVKPHYLIPMILSILAMAILPVGYEESPYGNYSSGAFLIVAFGCAYIYFLLMFSILIKYGKSMESKAKRGIIISLGALITATILQAAFKSLLVSSIGVTIINVAMFYTVESPDAMLIELLANEREKAEAANRSKSLFLAQMSHEIRTPINAVLGMNEMILRETDSDEIREYADNIKTSGKTLLALINGILDFSKIEDGKMELHNIEYELVSVVNSLVNSIEERAKNKDLKFTVEVDENLPSVLLGDDIRFTQVVLNLLTNAVKYTEKGSVTLVMKEKERSVNGVDIFVDVRDTGIGIKKEDMGRLFQTFMRLDEIKNHRIEGTGLGMAIVTRLLDLMGSKLDVESEYGKGSSFSFVLHQEIVDKTPIGNYSNHKKEEKEHIEEMPYAPYAKVLVVDDNAMNLKVAANLLKLFGIEPKVLSSGFECIETLKKESFHILLLDHMMPDMDGVETLKHIKEQELEKDMTIIALTANAVVGAREHYLSDGFKDYISKPMEIDVLRDMLKKYLPADLFIDRDASEEKKEPIVEEPKHEAVSDEPREIEVLEFDPVSEDEAMAMDFEDTIEALKKLDVNVDDGITHCGYDKEFYIEMVGDYIKDTEKKKNLNAYLSSKNWNDYKILVHALKSTSKTIGFMEISDMAKKLEDAAGREDEAYISENHPLLMKEYDRMVEAVSAIVL